MFKNKLFRAITIFSSGIATAAFALWVTRPFADFNPQDIFANTGILIAGLTVLVGAACAYAYFVDTDKKTAYLENKLCIDSITGLLSREGIVQAVARLIKNANDSKSLNRIYIISLDFDELKNVNTIYGTQTGDDVLKILANRLTALVGDAGPLARINGSEFVLALNARPDQLELVAAVQALLNTLSKPICIDTMSYPIYVNGGIAEVPRRNISFEKVLRNANLARSNAKQSGCSSYAIYHPEMSHQASYNRWLESELAYALERNEFQLFYQKQFDLNTGLLTGYEALLRWTHSEKGSISPAEFINIAENCGLIQELGLWVLRRACFDALALPTDTKIAVNVSPIQLEHPDFIESLRIVLKETKLPASRLELEITENVLIRNHARMRRLFKKIHEMGVSIAIDDFGTGYSNLTNLSELYFDKIKIDKSFVDRLEENRNHTLMIKTIINLGHSLGTQVIAEGIESENQARILKKAGCDLVQGYYFGKPMAFSELEKSLLKKQAA